MNGKLPLPRPAIFGVSLWALVDLYRFRLRKHKTQEFLAGLGVAVGVALFFGVLVANSSLIGSAGQILQAVTGEASLQLIARSSSGFDQNLADHVGDLPGVKVAASLLRENATLAGPRGREAIELVGVSPSLVLLRGSASMDLGAGALLLADGLGVPSDVASKTGAQSSEPVTILAAGSAHRVEVRVVLGAGTVGALADSPLVVALLATAQQITGQAHRVSQVLVEPKPGQTQLVEHELRRLAAGRIDIEPADQELSLLKATAAPTSQSTSLFAAIGAMVGFLLALNAMLLTVPDRRLFATELREQGFGPRQVMTVLVSQAVMLGIGASLIGVVFGGLLSRTLFQDVPSYLTLAFPLGTRPVIPTMTVLFALGCGIVATVLASMLPMADLRRDRKADAPLHERGGPGQSISKRSVAASGIAGLLLVGAVALVVLLVPRLSVAGGVALAVAAFCLIPSMFALIIGVLEPVTQRMRGSMLALAVIELRATATRSIALAGVAALAVFGIVAIQGARRDLVTGLDRAVVQYLDTADLWVTTDNNFLTINSFRNEGATSAIAHAQGIASVREYQGELLDVRTRRLWIRARPPGDRSMIQASQIIDGDLSEATRRIRRGGWAAVSEGFAHERQLHIGSVFALPTPTGTRRFKVAAITTNVGWPPGAITLNDTDYRRDWQSTEPTALEINLKPGVSPKMGKRIVERALRHRKGLLVETFNERKALYEQSARQGIQSLSDIATLLLIASFLAIAAALSAAIWQRRTRLASLTAQGFDRHQLWRSLLLESLFLLTIGCIDGAILGIYGHALASRWLKLVVGFPAPFSWGAGGVALTLAAIVCVALLAIAVPSLVAAKAPTSASFEE